MIVTGSSPLELKFDVIIDGAFVDKVSIQKASIELRENMHNLAVLDVAGIPPEYLTSYMNRPISIRVGVGNISAHYFVGYITYLEPVSTNKDGLVNKSPFQMTKLYCLGPTSVMRSHKTRVWNSMTLPQIAAQLASEHNFSISVPNNSYVFPRRVQDGKSDWAVLVEAANYLGYRVMSRGAHIDIWDPYALLSRNNGAVPIFAMTGNQGNVTADVGQVIKFQAYVGTSTPYGDYVPKTVHALIGSEIRTVTVEQASGYGEPLPQALVYEAAENAQSMEQAEAFLKGKKRFPITANVDIVGHPAIEPGTLVNLYKYDSGLDGIWVVQSACHDMVKGSAMTYLTLVRDSVDVGELLSPTTVSSPPLSIPEPIVRNNVWMSPRELVHVYA